MGATGLAGPFLQRPFVLSYPVTVLVSTRETSAVRFSEVAKARLLEIVGALRTVALRLLTIVLAGLETVFVRLVHSVFAVIKNVSAVVASVWRPGIISPAVRITPPATSETKRTIDARVSTNNYDSAATLRLYIARGNERDASEQHRCEDQTAYSP